MGSLAAQTVATSINNLHKEIRGHAHSMVDLAIEAGGLLLEEKKRLGHGNWLPWIRTNLVFSQETAAIYIRFYKHRDELNLQRVTNLRDGIKLLSKPTGKADKGEAAAPCPIGSISQTLDRLGARMTQLATTDPIPAYDYRTILEQFDAVKAQFERSFKPEEPRKTFPKIKKPVRGKVIDMKKLERKTIAPHYEPLEAEVRKIKKSIYKKRR
jgi:hypothetical protein